MDKGSFAFSVYSGDLFISFSCLLALARTSFMKLNRSGKSRHPSLVPDLMGDSFSLSPLYILAVGFSRIPLSC